MSNNINNQMENKFKEGQWLIRQWSDENGGEIDFCKFESTTNNECFFYTHCHRFSIGKLIYSKIDVINHRVKYIDSRMAFDWRVATKEELIEYSKMLFN